jgi:thymidylate synthase (methanogen type)
MLKFIKTQTCPEAWISVLKEIWNNGAIFNVKKGSEISETMKIDVVIEITEPWIRPLINPLVSIAELQIANKIITTEELQYLAEEYFKDWLWEDKGQSYEYTYANRMRMPVDQLQAVIDRLCEEPNDRQITVVLRQPQDIIQTKDPPCLSLIDLEVIDNKLNQYSYFRSWDCVLGLPFNIAGLQLLNERIVEEVQKRSRYILAGKLILMCKNLHIYKREYKAVEEILKSSSTKGIGSPVERAGGDFGQDLYPNLIPSIGGESI